MSPGVHASVPAVLSGSPGRAIAAVALASFRRPSPAFMQLGFAVVPIRIAPPRSLEMNALGTGYTLRSRYSRSHELMTWRNARSSHSFTAFQAPTNFSPRAPMSGGDSRSIRSDSARLSGSS